MGKKHKKHRSDWKLADSDQQSTEQRDKGALKLVFKIRNDDSQATATSSSSSPHRKKKKKSSHHHDHKVALPTPSTVATSSADMPNDVQMVEVCTDDYAFPASDGPPKAPEVPILPKEQHKALNSLLDSLLKELERKDPASIFAWPVNDTIAPGYSQLISYPMDFSTIRRKVDTSDYHHLREFKHDFDTMIDNCKRYNKEDTVFYKAAKKLKYSAKKIMSKERLISLRGAMPSLLAFTPAEYYSLVGVPLPENFDEEMELADGKLMIEGGTDMEFTQLQDFNNDQVSFTDADSNHTVAPDSKAAAQNARDRVERLRPNDRIGALVAGEKNGDLVLNFLNDEDENRKEVVKLSELTAVLGDGIDSLPIVKEDKRNKITPVEYLGYGAFSSFAPTYDSRSSNITQSESDMLLAAYGSDTGYLFAKSMQDFVSGSHPEVQDMVEDLLDKLTHGAHRTTQESLDTNAMLIHDLQRKQNDRLQVKPADGKPNVAPPGENECLVAGQVQTNLVSLAKHSKPGMLYEGSAVRECHGYADE